MPEHKSQKTEDLLDPNTEQLNVRVPKRLKEELSKVQEFRMVSSLGELIREVLREHVEKVEATEKYQWWVEQRLRAVYGTTPGGKPK